MKKIKIDTFTLLWITFIIYSKSSLVIHLLLAIIIHELGHILACFLMKVKIKHMYLSLLGARMELGGQFSYLQEFAIALGGPAMGILGYLIASSVGKNSQNMMTFALISLCLSIFNLFPIQSLDGGRIIKCLLCAILPLDATERIMQIITFFTLFLFWLLSTYMMIKFAGGVSAFVFCAIFFSKCFIFNTKKRDFESF